MLIARTALLLLGLAALAMCCRKCRDAGTERPRALQSRTEDEVSPVGSQPGDRAAQGSRPYERSVQDTGPTGAKEAPTEDTTKMNTDELGGVIGSFRRKCAANNRIEEGKFLYRLVRVGMTDGEVLHLLGEPTERKNGGEIWYYSLWYSSYIRLRIRDGKVLEREFKD